MKKTLAQVVREYKEYAELQEQLKKQLDELKTEAIELLAEAEIDEYLDEETGIKATYRAVISKRLDTTLLKKTLPDLFAAYQKSTTNMRFTCN